MKKTSFAKMQCSLARGLNLIGDWWSPLIIRDVYLGVARFDDLAEDLGISRNLLATRLTELVSRGVVEKVLYQERPPRFEYALTEKGRDLVPVILALAAWGDRWARPKEGSPILFRHSACGRIFVPVVSCPHCSIPVSSDAVTVLPGPGGAAKRGTKVLALRLRARMAGSRP